MTSMRACATCATRVRVAEQNRVGRVSGKRCNARGTHNVPLCSAAESGHVSEGELLASSMVRGPVLRLNGGVFEAQHCSHFDGSGSDNVCVVLAHRITVVNASMAPSDGRLNARCGRACPAAYSARRTPTASPLPRPGTHGTRQHICSAFSAPCNTTHAHTRTHQAP